MVLDLGGTRPTLTARSRAGKAGSGLLYEQVVDYVEELVAERGLVPGDLLPTYAELAASVGVSLITVRRALDELERAGKVRRHQGLGTFLARPRIVTEPTRAGSLLARWAARASEPGRDPRHPDPGDAARPALPRRGPARCSIRADAQVWRLRRQRMIDGQPAVVETSIIPVALAPDLDQQVGRLDGSLYDLLAAECGLEDEYEEQYLEVVLPGPEERRLLTIPPRTQVVRIRGLSMDKSGTPFDCFEQLYPATEFAFAISGSTSRHLFPTPGFQDWDVRALPERPAARPAPRGHPGCASPGRLPGPARSTRIAGGRGRPQSAARPAQLAAKLPSCPIALEPVAPLSCQHILDIHSMSSEGG